MSPSALPPLPVIETQPLPIDAAAVLPADAAAAYAVLLAPDADWGGAIAQAWPGAPAELAALIDAYGAPAAGKTTTIPLVGGPVARLILAAPAGEDGNAARSAAAAAARAAGKASILLLQAPEPYAAAVVEGVVLAGPTVHLGPQTREPDDTRRALGRLILLGAPDPGQVRLGTECARAAQTARALANTPSNVKNPPWLANQARAIGRAAGLRVTVWDEKALARDGFGGILAVGSGSVHEARLVMLEHRPGAATEPPIVLVGKGITFDTGGLNVKPAAGMLMMKTDMSGSAIVLGVMAGLKALGVRRRVIGLLPLAENAMGAASYRPGDVVTHYGGTTAEIGNTDAEGRIVLADALAYAAAELDPAALVDIATLTGHARIALASAMAPSYGTDDALHTRIRDAFAAAGEPVWPMPLVEDYRSSLESDVADLSHIGPIGGQGAGSILAALFLREFTGGRPWVHLDIAGTGRSESDTGFLAKGATGYGTRGLLRWLVEE